MADTTFTDQSTTIVAAWLNQVNLAVLQGRSPNMGTTTGSANAQVLTLATGSLYTSRTMGDTFGFVAGFSNNAATTLQIIAPAGVLSAAALKLNGAALTGGEIIAGQPYIVGWDGTAWQLVSLAGTVFGTSLLQLANAAALVTLIGAIPQSVLTTVGDMILRGASQAERLPAAATVAAHATTMNPWVARVVTLSGGAVTFTDIADAAFVGQEVLLVMNAAHVWTDGAVFDVQGGANYTAAAGDMVLITAVTVSTFDVTIFKASGATTAKLPTVTVIASGSGTYTTPTGATCIVVEGWGGGGSGGGGDGANRGTGGGGGGYFKKTIINPAASYSYTVGAAGAAVAQGNNGAAGGNTTFSTLTANGGSGGTVASGSAIGGSAGGAATGGDENIIGGSSDTQQTGLQSAAGGDSSRGGFGGKSNVSAPGQVPGGGGACANGTGNSGAGALGQITVTETYT